MLAQSKLKKPIIKGVLYLEFFLASLVVIGTGLYLFISLGPLLGDLGNPQLFFGDLVAIFLSSIIGVEVARVLITHNLAAMFDVLGLILVRKALNPETSALEVLVVIIGFIILFIVWHHSHQTQTSSSNLSTAIDKLTQ